MIRPILLAGLLLVPATRADDGNRPLKGVAVLVDASRASSSTYTQDIPVLQRSLGRAPRKLVLAGRALPRLDCKVLVMLTGCAPGTRSPGPALPAGVPSPAGHLL